MYFVFRFLLEMNMESVECMVDLRKVFSANPLPMHPHLTIELLNFFPMLIQHRLSLSSKEYS